MSATVKVFWLFGRSAAGKTTLARRLHGALRDRNLPALYLDGDEMRSGLSADLGFTPAARLENHRRCAEVARLAVTQGFNVVVSTIAPECSHRDEVQKILGAHLVWFYIHAPLDICVQRDPKGLYRKARAGQLQQLLDCPFDVPRPRERENYIDTVAQNIDDCHQFIFDVVCRRLMTVDLAAVTNKSIPLRAALFSHHSPSCD
jgi:adenylyl-sulfate kinase